MAFIKHGDGKITNIIENDNLTEEQKKLAQELSENNKLQDENVENILTKRENNVH